MIVRLICVAIVSCLSSFVGLAQQVDSIHIEADSGLIIYDNISDLRKSFQYPTFNGSYRPIQWMTVEAMRRAYEYEPGMNVRPTGTTVIQIFIDRNGIVKNPRVVKSVWATLDDKILNNIIKIPHITPGSLKDEPIDTKITISIEWDLGRTYFTYQPYNLNI